jgi:ABC-2 type transport system permease protein
MTPRHRLRSLVTLVYMNGLIPMRTQPLYLVNTIASPLGFLFIIFVVSGGHLLIGIAGGLLLTIMSIGTSLQSDMTHYKVDMKFQDMVVASPVEAPTYVSGMALSEFVYSIPGVGVFVFLWATHATDVSVLGVLTVVGVLILAWAFASALGFTLATYFEDVRETFVFSPLISLGLTVLPPVYYPVSLLQSVSPPLLGKIATILALCSPTTYAADLLKKGMGGFPSTFLPAWVDWVALGVATVLFLILASAKARWREP